MTRELSIRLLFTVVTRAAIVLFFFFLFDFIYFEQYKLWYIEFRETLSLLKKNNDRLERKIAVIETEGEILGR